MPSVNLLPAELVAHIVAFLLLDSLAHRTLRINQAFRDATRNHIDTVVLPVLAPLRDAPFNIHPANVLSTHEIELFGHIRDKDMKALASAVTMGAMAELTYLDLGYNQISNEGMQALSSAIANGAMGLLTVSATLHIPHFHLSAYPPLVCWHRSCG